MHAPDTDAFATQMRELALVFRLPKGVETVDVLINPYWNALKDLSIESVVRSCANYKRYGKGFFPLPHQLRPPDSKPPTQTSDAERAKQQHFERQCIATWNRALVKNSLHTRWAMLDAYHCRTHSGAYAPNTQMFADRCALAATALAKLRHEGDGGYRRAEILRQEIDALPAPSLAMAF